MVKFSSAKMKAGLISRIVSTNFQRVRTLHITGANVPVKEIKIPLLHGHMAAKLWGNEQDRPILAIHGWQDNAGTWNPLAPMIVNKTNRPILAVDLPGHGLSSWIPSGMNYYAWEYARIILYLKEYYKWDKVSLLGHSMGGVAGFRYASLFKDVDIFIAIDKFLFDYYEKNFAFKYYPALWRKNEQVQKRITEEPPSYSREELIKTWYLSTEQAIDKDSFKHLLERGAKQSKKDPNKYYFTRDPRAKYAVNLSENIEFLESQAMQLKCPTLYIKAKDSQYGADPVSLGVLNLIEKNNEHFERHLLPGTHYIHLNNPELVYPLIINFLDKHKIPT